MGAYRTLGAMHNRLGVTDSVEVEIGHFYGRPFYVINTHAFIDALTGAIKDTEVSAIRTDGGCGPVLRQHGSPQLHRGVYEAEGAVRVAATRPGARNHATLFLPPPLHAGVKEVEARCATLWPRLHSARAGD